MSRPIVSERKAPGFRKSNTWLHRWAGLLLGWLMFAIFFFGSISFYQRELDLWAKPELHFAGSDTVGLNHAIGYLSKEAPKALQWSIGLASPRQPAMLLRWRLPDEENRSSRSRIRWLDPEDGRVLHARKTQLARFFYRFHFELYSMPRDVGRWIVGVATLVMFLALLTGIVAHKKIFLDFFTLRLFKGQRSWMDFHNLIGVAALPFHLILTFSGLLLVMYTIMPFGVSALYGDDFKQFRRDGGGSGGVSIALEKLGQKTHKVELPPGSLSDRVPVLVSTASDYWSQPIARVIIDKPLSPDARIKLIARGASSLLNRASASTMTYRLADGALIKARQREAATRFARATYNVFTALHLQRYADPLQRALYFFGGLLGTLMVASGLVLWLVKRQPKMVKRGQSHTGFRCVQIVNVAVLAGLPVATASAMLINRILPASLAQRSDWEIRAFFLCWVATLIFALLRPYRAAARQLCKLFAWLIGSLATFNVLVFYPLSGYDYLGWWRTDGLVKGVDLVLLLFSLTATYLARQLREEQQPITAKEISRQMYVQANK